MKHILSLAAVGVGVGAAGALGVAAARGRAQRRRSLQRALPALLEMVALHRAAGGDLQEATANAVKGSRLGVLAPLRKRLNESEGAPWAELSAFVAERGLAGLALDLDVIYCTDRLWQARSSAR